MDSAKVIACHVPWVSAHGFAILSGIWAVITGTLAYNNAQKAALYDAVLQDRVNNSSNNSTGSITEEDKLKKRFSKISSLDYRYFMPVSMIVALGAATFLSDGLKSLYAYIGLRYWICTVVIISLAVAGFFWFIDATTEENSRKRKIFLGLALAIITLVLVFSVPLFTGISPLQQFLYKVIGIFVVSVLGFLGYYVFQAINPYYNKHKWIFFYATQIFNTIVYTSVLYGITIFAYNVAKKYIH
ncbi:hypothetical protein [Gluconobacter kondonii]|uniref:DUF998 domain-containing protein n=1 Tax=Gluconobacter kondonii TaxID=941463 RepID=A0ABQ5WV64_9PROT|nr:hypothetical protein [Gluconobacter kondonii]GBR41768.1 hypothetical protein AA3266_2859 [Gluconobacter kondonii NBRC 3266]GLQ67448.1 hypothetical protein GCM10007870_30330 [Gluconobacter kondonii]